MLKGVITALITPFDNDSNIDFAGLRSNIRFQLSQGIHGLVPLGTTGESPTITAKEKLTIIEVTIEEAGGRVPVYVGTGSYSTQTTLESTLQAKKMGADGALIVTPYYNRPTQEGIYRHYITVAEATDFPIIVYNNQGRTGQNTFVSTMQRLAMHPQIIGVKEASGSIHQMMEIFEAICLIRPDFSLLCGDDSLILPCMSIGGHGVISVISNLLPLPLLDIYNAICSSNFDQAQDIYYRLHPLIKAIFIETNPIPLKAAMSYYGLPSGGCRLPLCELGEDNKSYLIKVMEEVMKTFASASPACPSAASKFGCVEA